MSIRQTFLAIDGRVSRMIRRHRFGRGLAAFGMTVAAVVFGTVASATPILSFPSVQVTADGINPTPVSITVSVNNNASAFDVIAFTGQFEWTASGSASDADLSSLADDGTASTAGMLFANVSPLFDLAAGSSEPKDFSVAGNSFTPVTMAGGSTQLATLNLLVAAGVTSGQFVVDFVTGSTVFNSFSDTAAQPVLYTNGNNGTTLGVITVVPEASSSVILASGALLATGVGFAQRRARRTTRKVEIAG
jgi:hypothetical protein